MSDSKASLTIRHDPSTEQEYPLEESSITIGREAFNDIVVYDPEASRRHAQISFQDGRYILEDLGSTNGTFISGRRVSVPTPLHNGDVIEIGESSRIVFNWVTADLGETVVRPEASQGLDKTVADPSAVSDWEVQLAEAKSSAAPEPFADESYAVEVGEPFGDDAYEAELAEPLVTPSEEPKRNNRRYLLGCGCLVLAGVVLCAAAVFLLDALEPDLLYCGPAQPFFDLFNVTCP